MKNQARIQVAYAICMINLAIAFGSSHMSDMVPIRFIMIGVTVFTLTLIALLLWRVPPVKTLNDASALRNVILKGSVLCGALFAAVVLILIYQKALLRYQVGMVMFGLIMIMVPIRVFDVAMLRYRDQLR